MRLKSRQDERGMALLAALMMVLIFSLLGMASLQFAGQETVGVKAIHDDHIARHAADAALELVMHWFHEPGASAYVPEMQLFSKRAVDAAGRPAFVDARGISQFKGSAESPDILLDAGNPQHDALMNHPETGWFRSLRGLAKILKLKVYGPIHPGLVCTVEVVSASGQGEAKSTVSVEFGTYSIPPVTSAVQTAGFKPGAPLDAAAPIHVHWGDLKARGNVVLVNQQDVPAKTTAAPVNGQSYAEMEERQDRWIDLYAGGTVMFARPLPGRSEALPENVHQNQDPMPGMRMDPWQYEELKHLAMSLGTYYVIDEEGRLHSGAVVRPGQGLAADEVLASHAVGEHRGLVFIDTLDQQPPRPDNLGTVTLGAEYLEGLFIINAHVVWQPRNSTKTIPALSPPPEDSAVLGLRIPAQLSGVNLRGVMYTAGNLTYCGRPRVYGGVLSDGVIGTCLNQYALLEVWYDFDLKDGLHRGVPLVYMAPGTWQNKL
jgi:hypothetical protein